MILYRNCDSVTMPKNSSNKTRQAVRRDNAGSNSDRSRSGPERNVPAMAARSSGAASSSNIPSLLDFELNAAESDSSTPPRTLAMQRADRIVHQQQLAAMDQGGDVVMSHSAASGLAAVPCMAAAAVLVVIP